MSGSEALDSPTLRQVKFPLLHSLRMIRKDQEETAHGARLVLTVDRRQAERNYQDFLADPEGCRILDGAPSVFDLLTDRVSLGELPEGSLGRAYLDYMIGEGLSTEALDAEVEPVETEVLGSDAPRKRFHQHMRASHDLWHVLTGYHRDLIGELQLIAFSQSQTGSPAYRWITRLAPLKIGRQVPEIRALLKLAGKRGRHTRWLATANWAALLARPIGETRETLGMGPPPEYTRRVANPNGRGLIREQAMN